MKIAVRAIVKGRVQGVGYRWFAKENANRFNLNGYVKNLPNGDVEVFVEGDREKVTQYLRLLQNGPSFSSIIDFEVNHFPYKKSFTQFKVEF